MSAIGSNVAAITVNTGTEPAGSEVIFQGPLTLGWNRDVNGGNGYYHQTGVNPAGLTEGRRIEIVLTITQNNPNNSGSYGAPAKTTVVVPYTIGGHSSSFVANLLQDSSSRYTSYVLIAADVIYGKLFFVNNILCVQILNQHCDTDLDVPTLSPKMFGSNGTSLASNMHIASIVLEEIRTRV